MEKYQQDLENAKNKLKIADHMVNVTFPMLRDPKLLLSASDSLYTAYTNALSALLNFERLYKRVPPFNPTFESMFFLYHRSVRERLGIDNKHSIAIKELKNIVAEHSKSPIEFTRNDKLVICSDRYSTLVLSHQNTKEYLVKAKLFIQEITSILENDRRTK